MLPLVFVGHFEPTRSVAVVGRALRNKFYGNVAPGTDWGRAHARDKLLVSPQAKQCVVKPLTPIDPYTGRTAPLTSKRCILYIYSTNTDTEYFKHDIYSSFLSRQNAVCFIILTYLVPVLFKFYI